MPRPSGVRVVLALVVAMCSCLSALARWTDVPDDLYCDILTYDYRGHPYYTSSIALAPWIWSVVSQLYKGTGLSGDDLRVWYEGVTGICTVKWGEGSRFLYARVIPGDGEEGKAYWRPWQLVFVQDQRQYPITTADLLALSDTFSGPVYALMDGFVRVPDQIDYSRPFQIWYGTYSDTLGPISSGFAQAPGSIHSAGKAAPAPSSGGFFEDFSDSQHPGWEEYVLQGSVTGNSRGWIQDGAFLIQVDSVPYFSLQEYKGPGASDFVFEADVMMLLGPNQGSFGLVVRHVSGGNWYAALLHQSGRVRWLVCENGIQRELTGWQACGSCHTGNGTNRLAVVAKGSFLRLYVNGVLISAVVNAAFTAGVPGFIVMTAPGTSQPLRVSFDNVRFMPNSEAITATGVNQ